MPRIQENQRSNKPHDIRRTQGNNDRKKLLIRKQFRKCKTVLLKFLLDGLNSHEDSSECQVDHDSNPKVHHGHVKLVRSAWSVAQGQNEASYQGREIEPFENNTQYLTDIT